MEYLPKRNHLSAAVLAISLGMAVPTLAYADNAPVAIDLPAQALDKAVLELASQSDLIIGGDAAILKGKTAPALQGNYTPEQALEMLLKGSGVSYRFTGDNSVTLLRAPDANDGVTALPPVRVSAASIAAAQNSLNYGRTEVEQLQPQDIKQLFQKDSAVAVGGSLPINQKVYVRGVEETALAVSVDGGRQNNRVFHHNATNLIDPALLKAVRASAGVSPADDGPGAIGGSLVFETVDVVDVLEAGKNLGGFVNGRYGSNGDQTSLSGSLYGRSQGFEFLGYINQADGDDYEDGDGNTTPFSEPALQSGLAKIAYETAQAGRFELSHETVNDDSLRPYRANFVGLSAGRPVPESRIYDLTRDNTTFNYSMETGSGWWNPSVTLADNETELVTTEVPLSDPTASISYTGITESTTMRLKNLFHTGFADITAGVDYYEDTVTFKFAGDPDIVEEVENTGLFVQLRQTLGDSVELSYGLRHDSQDFTGVDGSDHDDSGISGNVFGEFQLTEHISLNAGYAEVWGGTVLAENFILNPGWVYTDVKAVEANNYTLGLHAQFDGFIIEANSYRTEIDNGRTPSYGGGPDLVADFKIEGYDVSFGYIAEHGEIFIKYADIESERDGEPATSFSATYFTVPLGEIVTITGELNIPTMPLQLGLNAEFALENDAVEGSGAKQESYTVVDIYADYAMTDALELRLSIDNVLDEAYTDRASYGQEFTTVDTFLEPGRSFNLNARYSF